MGELDNERLRDVLDSSADVIDGEETAQAAAKA
jgi:hypothetical protein